MGGKVGMPSTKIDDSRNGDGGLCENMVDESSGRADLRAFCGMRA